MSVIVEGVWSDVERWKDMKSPRILHGVKVASTGGLASTSAEVLCGKFVGIQLRIWRGCL